MKTDPYMDELANDIQKLAQLIAKYENIPFADHRYSYLVDHKRELIGFKVDISSALEYLIRTIES
jgi:hypothetical protein